MSPRHFSNARAFRAWLERHHASEAELLVAFYKKHTGKAGLTYPEAVEEALCFGWIDGIKKRLDEEAFTHRFTPRKARSIWSNINVRRVEALTQARRMTPAGMAAFAARHPARTGISSFEGKAATFDAASIERFKSHRQAWSFFDRQPPGYRRIAAHWAMSAKQETTRQRRLGQLIADSARGLRLGHVAGPSKGKRQPT